MDKAKIQVAFDYFDHLRDSGATNMWGAAPWLVQFCGYDKADADKLHIAWMDSFDPNLSAGERAASVDL